MSDFQAAVERFERAAAELEKARAALFALAPKAGATKNPLWRVTAPDGESATTCDPVLAEDWRARGWFVETLS